MVVFFLFVAGSNLALGFLLAMYLVVRHRGRNPILARSERHGGRTAGGTRPSTVRADDTEVLAADLPKSPAAALREPSSLGALPAERPAALVSASITEFKTELSRYRDQLCALDKQMRVGAEAQDAASIKECLTTLRTANDQYLDQQSEASGRLQSRCASPSSSRSTANWAKHSISKLRR